MRDAAQLILNTTLIVTVVLLSVQLHTTTQRLEALEAGRATVVAVGGEMNGGGETRRALAEAAEETETAHSQAAECHSVDDVAMAALNASVALSQSHAQLTEWLTSKANVSDVESLTQDVSRKVSVAELAAVSATLSGKADESSVVEWLAEKMGRADVLEMLSEKANASAVTALQAGKADAATVDALSTAVAGKVDQSALKAERIRPLRSRSASARRRLSAPPPQRAKRSWGRAWAS